MAVLLNNGDGTFSAAAVYPVSPISQAPGNKDYVVDLNGDGAPDIVTPFEILFNNGDGTFGTPVALPGPSVAPAVGDFYSDGRASLATWAYYTSTNLELWHNRGDGTFFQTSYSIDLGYATPPFLVGDANNDGHADILFASGNGCYWLLGNGDGTFTQGPYNTATVGGGGWTIADVNADGLPDVVQAPLYHSWVSVSNNQGGGVVAYPVLYPTEANAYMVRVADIDGDNKPDLVVSQPDANLSILLNNSDGTFQPFQTVPLQLEYANGGTLGLAVGDVNKDGRQDIVVGDNSNDGSGNNGHSVIVLLNESPKLGNVAFPSLM
jgi:hypothetical protein